MWSYIQKGNHHHHHSLNREGRWGTTDDFATSFLHFSLFSTALWDLPNSSPVHKGNKSVLSLMTGSDALPIAFQKWNTVSDNLKYKNISYKTIKATTDTRLRWFQTRLLHGILPTDRYLFLREIIDSPLCSFCKQKEETIFQLFWRCTVIQSFWSNLQSLIKEICINCTHFELSEALVLFGVTDNIITDKVIDLFILLAEFLLNC